jgi:FtsP/CotA-like multicopper oxidase with cupredoxin domain
LFESEGRGEEQKGQVRVRAVEPNLVWKDTVLVPTGQTVDILLAVTNPGRWMAHCHIRRAPRERMMFSSSVDP